MKTQAFASSLLISAIGLASKGPNMVERSQNKIRILVAESFELVRIGLRSLFANHASIRLVADTSCIEELVNLTLQHKPDVILVDLLLNNGNCIDHISKLLNACPQSKVLAFPIRIMKISICKPFVPVQ